jgi:hypothetical protein
LNRFCGSGTKLANSWTGPWRLRCAVRFMPVYDPAPIPVQPPHVYPLDGVAVIVDVTFAATQVDAAGGVTAPPVDRRTDSW